MHHLIVNFPVRHGSHQSFDEGMCAMELVAFLAGEPHSDGPACASPVIAAFVRAFNDVIPNDSGRSYYLRSWIPKLINTVAEEAIEEQRATVVIDFMVRTMLPLKLMAEGSPDSAREFAELKPIKTRTGVILAGLAVRQEEGYDRIAAAIKLASRDRAPATWVPSAAKMIQDLGTPAAFDLGTRLIGRLIKVGSEPVEKRVSRVHWSAPPTA